jgi:hypothetical protein
MHAFVSVLFAGETITLAWAMEAMRVSALL